MGISEPGNSNAEKDEKENSPFIRDRDSDRVSIWACNGNIDRKAEEKTESKTILNPLHAFNVSADFLRKISLKVKEGKKIKT